MKLSRLSFLILPLLAGCVSPPVYQTVSTHQGLRVGAGVSYQSAYRAGAWEDEGSAYGEFTGFRPDFLIGYGASETFSLEGRFGMFVSPAVHWQGEEEDSTEGDLRIPVPMAGVGLKLSSTPGGQFNTAVRMDVDFPNIASIMPMIGISTKKGHEFLTVGFQTTYLFIPRTAFLNIHPVKGLHLYGGVDILPGQLKIQELSLSGDDFFESFCVGLAYTYRVEE